MSNAGNQTPAQAGKEQRVAIVGGGLAGSLLALALAQRGYAVDVYERRADPRASGAAGRSINLGMSKRGITGLQLVGLLDEILSRSVVMAGRVIHGIDSSTQYQPYGKNETEVLHSIDRVLLIHVLLNRAEQHPGVKLHFEHRLVGCDKQKRELTLETADGASHTVSPAFVVGADGAFSTMRQLLQRGERADYHQEYLEWGYKELVLAAKPDGSSVIEQKVLHVWPRNHGLIVTHPNQNGSHTLSLFLPHEGEDSFGSVKTPEQIKALFGRFFPDLMPLMPDLVEQWQTHPASDLITTRTNPWCFGDWAVLVGDAVHAVYPLMGQGMNAAFEDCCVLVASLEQYKGDTAGAFRHYQDSRRQHTDALAELSVPHFVELRKKVQSPWFQARKKLDLMLNRLMPTLWIPLYTMISHTTIPYREAQEKAQRQDAILRNVALAVGFGIILLLGRMIFAA